MGNAIRIWGVPLALLLLLPPSGVLEAQERTYQEMREEVGTLFEAGRYLEAAEILEDALDRYPGHLLANSTNLAIVRVRAGDPDGGLQALLQGLEGGVWYGKYALLEELWDPVKALPGWTRFQAMNEGARTAAQENVRRRMSVLLPQGYDPDRQYPLFLALHGGGENLELFMPHWTSPLLQEEFIVAYPQSTQLVAMDGYNWTEDVGRSVEEIQSAFHEVVRDYSVDENQVVVGGFSSGGVASLEVVLRNALPVKGFVVLCPATPEDFTPEGVRAARDRGIRGTILTTEMDGRLDQQRRMEELMTREGLPHEFYVTPDIGHWYPQDLAQRIDRAILHIRGGGGTG